MGVAIAIDPFIGWVVFESSAAAKSISSQGPKKSQPLATKIIPDEGLRAWELKMMDVHKKVL